MSADFFAEVGTILLLIVVSGTKFLTAPAVILAAGYSKLATIIITFVGGSLGCTFFFYLGGRVFKWWQRYFPSKKKKTFSRKNRILVKFKNRFGVLGIAALIPLISIPASCFLAAKYFANDKKAIPAYVLSSFVYSILLTLFSEPVIDFLKKAF